MKLKVLTGWFLAISSLAVVTTFGYSLWQRAIHGIKHAKTIQSREVRHFPHGHITSLDVNAEFADVTVKTGKVSEIELVVTRTGMGSDVAAASSSLSTIRYSIAQSKNGLVFRSNSSDHAGISVDRGNIRFASRRMALSILVPQGKKMDTRVIAGSGDLKVEGLDGKIVLESGSGGVVVTGGSGATSISTGSGDIMLKDRVAGSVNLEAGSGDVTYHCSQPTRDDVSIETGSGDVLARFDPTSGLSFMVNTGSGKIVNRLYGVSSSAGDSGLTFKLGGGRHLVNVTTGSGDVSLEASRGT